jgi:hypothetical protein
VDRAQLVRLDGTALVDRAAQDVHDAAERAQANGHGDRRAGGFHLHAAAQAVGGAERDGAHHAVAELLLDLEREAFLGERVGRVVLEDERFVDSGQGLAVELDVGDRADALDDGALTFTVCLCHSFS